MHSSSVVLKESQTEAAAWPKRQHVCTTGCVANCGKLTSNLLHGAETRQKTTSASELVECFRDTCQCQLDRQWHRWQIEDKADRNVFSVELARDYFELVHSRERVKYLMLADNSRDPDLHTLLNS